MLSSFHTSVNKGVDKILLFCLFVFIFRIKFLKEKFKFCFNFE